MKKYEEYKDSGIEWVGEIPEHWEIKALKHISEITLGKMLTNEDKGGYQKKPYLRGANINWEKVNVDDVKEMWFSDNELKQYKLKENDLLVSEGGEAGRTCIWKSELDECYIQNSVHKVTINSKCNPTYYLYHFQIYGKGGYFNAIVNRVSIAHLTREKLKEVKFLYPPAEAQNTITNYLDYKTSLIDKLIEKNEKLIHLLEEQRSAIINQAVTKGLDPDVKMKDSGIEWIGKIPEHWEVKKLKYIGKSIIGITYNPNEIVEDYSEGTLVLRASNIQDGRLSLNDNVYIKKTIQYKYRLRLGDILICSRNGSKALIGKNICIDNRAEGNTFGAFMTVVRSNYWIFLSKFFNSQIFSAQSELFSTSTINQLTINIINNMYVAIPSKKEEQTQIANYLDHKTSLIDKLTEEKRKTNEHLKEYRTTLISNVVTGKIDVREKKIPESFN